jgi:hypothetical protein
VGAVVGWIGNYMMQRLRQSSERHDKLVASYVRWFTLQKMALLRIQVLYNRIGKSIESQEEYESASAELERLFPLYEGMLHAFHEILILERGKVLCQSLQGLTDLVEQLYSAISRQLLEIRDSVVQIERVRGMKGRLRDLPASTEESKVIREQVATMEADIEQGHVSLMDVLRRGNESIAKLNDELCQRTSTLLPLVAKRMELWPKKLG